MKKTYRFRIGNWLYSEWTKPIVDYYFSIKLKYVTFEIVFPLIIAVICTRMYTCADKVSLALDKLCELLPTAISILIGFTTLLITLLLTSSGQNVERLKSIDTDLKLNNAYLNLFQCLHIQFSHSLFSEILFLILIFFYQFINGLGSWNLVQCAFLCVFVYYILNILLSILRGITNIYFSFYRTSSK